MPLFFAELAMSVLVEIGADMVGDSPGKAPFIARATVKTVMRALSAIGSITVPTTVP